MVNKKIVFLVVTAAVLIGGGYLVISSNQSGNFPSRVSQSQNPELVKRYLEYSPGNLAKATANNGKAVLFFAALRWCPTCQAADRDFKANFDRLPKDVSILMADYDTATDLKKKYAVTFQDTFIQVDGQGNEITRWSSGGQGVSALLANLK